MASGCLAEMWGPRCSAAMIWERDQSVPQSTGQPFCAHSLSNGVVAWLAASDDGYMVLPMAWRSGVSDGMVSSLSSVEEMRVSICAGVSVCGGWWKISSWIDAGVRL